MLKVGITGGIGSGKSTVCRIFEQYGIPVYYADQRAKALMLEDAEVREKIRSLFGNEAYLEDGSLNRKHIGNLAFSDPSLLQQLNAAVHPAVARDFLQWAKVQNSPYVLKEAALLFEAGTFRDLDYVVTVYAPKELRIRRTMERDGVTREAVLDRIRKQWTEKQRQEAADFVVRNDESHSLIRQVQALHEKFMFAAKG